MNDPPVWDEDQWRRFGRATPPPLPEPATRALLDMTTREDIDLRDLAFALEDHHRLRFCLVILANGPVWGTARPARTVDDAVRQLGRRGCALAAWIAAVHDVIHLSGELAPRPADRLWRHLALTGLLCRELVKELGLTGLPGLLDEGLAAGLVHDLGHLLLEQPGARLNVVWHDEHELLLEGEVPPPEELDHSLLGGALLELWEAPGELVDVALHHHDCLAAPQPHQPLVIAARLADLLAERVHAEEDVSGWSLRNDPEVLTLHEQDLLWGTSPREIEAILMCALPEAQIQADRWSGLLAVR